MKKFTATVTAIFTLALCTFVQADEQGVKKFLSKDMKSYTMAIVAETISENPKITAHYIPEYDVLDVTYDMSQDVSRTDVELVGDAFSVPIGRLLAKEYCSKKNMVTLLESGTSIKATYVAHGHTLAEAVVTAMDCNGI